MKKFLITDGNSMLFRAYYATAYGKPMTTREGIPTNAVFGFVSMLQKAIDTMEPDSVLIAFDAGKHTFRHDLYPEYKGGRKPAPDDLVPQFKIVRDLLDAMNIKWVEMPDIEADDLIGTASGMSEEYNTVILTSDHDMLQLVDDTTSVLLMKKGLTEMDVMTPSVMMETMGIVPKQIIDMKGLMGDKSDNIPGIPGIGEKTALKLLQQYETVEGVLAHTDELKGAMQKKIIAGHDSALLSKTLATIRRDVVLDFTPDDCLFAPDYASTVRFLKSLDMNATAAKYEQRLSADLPEESEPAGEQMKFERVSCIDAKYFKDECSVYADETGGSYLKAEFTGLALCFEHECFYIDKEDILQDSDLLSYLASDIPHKTGYDTKRVMHLLENTGIAISFHDDAMIAASLADSSLSSTDKIMEHFNLSLPVTLEDVYGKPGKEILLIDPELQMQHACQEAVNISSLIRQARAKVEEYEMKDLYYGIEMPLTEILYRMEKEGIRCEISVLDQISEDVKAKMDAEAQKIYTYAGREFNINSTKQLSEVLYDDLGLYSGKKRSTSADKLEKLRGDHPVIDCILAYRRYQKIYSTYAEGLKKYICRDGRIHTLFNQCVTATGRLSSSEPNLQNISVRDEEGKVIRKAFIPEDGCVLISSDYHQIELRMLAHMADEESLIEAFNMGIDIHTKTAMDVFDVAQEDVTPLMRRQAKTVNFGIVYGISDFGLAEQLGVKRKEAADFIETYYAKYPRIRTYMDSVVKECEQKGYSLTMCGRRREIPEIHDKNYMVREFGKRAAMNAPIQGSAADLIKLAMIAVDRMMKEKGVRSRMILQVHDELIFNVPEEEIETMKQIISDGMEHAMTLKVPLTSECAVGKDWYEAK